MLLIGYNVFAINGVNYQVNNSGKVSGSFNVFNPTVFRRLTSFDVHMLHYHYISHWVFLAE